MAPEEPPLSEPFSATDQRLEEQQLQHPLQQQQLFFQGMQDLNYDASNPGGCKRRRGSGAAQGLEKQHTPDMMLYVPRDPCLHPMHLLLLLLLMAEMLSHVPAACHHSRCHRRRTAHPARE